MIEQPLQTTEDNLAEAFNNIGNKNEVAETVKLLFDNKQPDIIVQISDLTPKQAAIALRIWGIAEAKDIPIWKNTLLFYMQLQLSKNRSSRREVLNAIQGATQQRSFMDKINPMVWRRQ